MTKSDIKAEPQNRISKEVLKDEYRRHGGTRYSCQPNKIWLGED